MGTTAKSESELLKELENLKLRNESVEKELTDCKKLVDNLRLTQHSIDNIADSIFWIDEFANFHFVNNAACRNLGYSKEELLSMTIFDIDPVFPKEELKEHWQEIQKHGSVVIETIHRTKDGKDIPVEVTTNFVEYNGKQYNCANAHNITERKKAEEVLLQRKREYKTTIDELLIGVVVHDAEGNVLICNNQASTMLGLTFEQMLGKELIAPEWMFVYNDLSRMKVEDYPVSKVISTNKSIKDYDIGIVCPDREYVTWVNVNATPIFFENGKLEKVIVNFHDISESKRAKEELEKTEATHNKMVANLGDVIVIIDKDGINKYKSPNVENLFGWKPKELVGNSTWDNIHPEDLNSAKEFIKSLMVNPKEIGTAEMRYKCKNGAYKWIEFIGVNLLHDEDINGILGNYHDINDRKLIEKSLIESETRFKALHNASFGGITIHDKGIILECNQGLCEITGYSFDELIGMNGLNLIAENSRDFVMDKILSGYEKPYESIGLRKNGEEYPIRLEARNVPYKGKIVRTVEFRDTTEQKKSEQALRESEQKFKDLANLLPQTIFETDSKMNITLINKEATDAFGYTEEDIKAGLNAMEVIVPEDRDRAKNNIVKVFNTNSNSSNEYRGLRKDGSTFPIIVSSSLIVKDNIPVGLRGIIVDITQRKQAEEELQEQNKLLETQYEEYMKLNEVLRKTNFDLEKAKQEAEESNKAKSIFLANMSHELRTPLVGILGYSDLLVKFIEDEELNEMAMGVNRTGKRLLDTISLILDLSKIEADNYETNIGEHDIMLILKEVFDSLNGGALAKHLDFSFSPHMENFIIDTDPEMFRIVFENIIGNAIKFTTAGSVVISTFEEDYNDSKLLNIKVSDTGIGIDEDDIPNIFEEFKQLSEGTTKNFPGSGLGLSITKRFVELLKGTIDIKSEKGIGTTVTVKFPIY